MRAKKKKKKREKGEKGKEKKREKKGKKDGKKRGEEKHPVRFRSRGVRDAKRAFLTAQDEAALPAARGADARTWDHRGVPLGCD